jgi:hypothetical protein
MGNYVFNPNTGKVELATDQNRPITSGTQDTAQQVQNTVSSGDSVANVDGQVDNGPLPLYQQINMNNHLFHIQEIWVPHKSYIQLNLEHMK